MLVRVEVLGKGVGFVDRVDKVLCREFFEEDFLSRSSLKEGECEYGLFFIEVGGKEDELKGRIKKVLGLLKRMKGLLRVCSIVYEVRDYNHIIVVGRKKKRRKK